MFSLSNQSDPGNYYWDFCSGDLLNTPSAQNSATISGAIGRPGIEFAKDGNAWYGFVTGTWTNSLYRVRFANGTNNPPTFVENLGNPSGLLDNPGQVRVIKENNNWYCFVHNTGTGEMVMMSFGNSLLNSFTTSILFSGAGSTNSGFALGKDGSNGWVCVISESTNQFKIIRLGNTLSSPTPADILTSSTVPSPNNLGDLDLVNVCGSWYGFADNLGNGNVYKLDFGTSLFSIPAITQLASLPGGNGGRLRVAAEGGRYFLFVLTLDGTLSKLDFQNDITSIPSIISEGTIGGVLQPNTYGLALAIENSVWSVLSVNLSNGQLYQINYPDNCSAVPKVSTLADPQVTYSQSGTYLVSLQTTAASGSSSKTQPISISTSTAPDINFTTQNNCAKNNIIFTSSNSAGNVTGYSWDFGDGSSLSTGAGPTHIYATAGDFLVNLTVNGSNGCSNSAVDSLRVYNPPQASFTIPAVSTICTNQSYTFNNTSQVDAGSNPSWQWTVNGTNVSTAQNLLYTIPTPVKQDLVLTVSIAGCSSQSTATINTVVAGPLVGLNSSNTGCAGSSIQFANTTTGPATSYLWDFGDGNSSSQTTPVSVSNSYASAGPYTIKLTASNAAGCQNFVSRNISIYSNPQPAFVIEAPPFSCANYPAQFDNNTPALTDSNISSWAWSFGDPANGTSSQKNPAYTYTAAGPYTVSLKATTNFGCTATMQASISIAPSPTAGFTSSPACVNQGTQFTDASSGSISLYQWSVQGNTLTGLKPSLYIFKTPGTFPLTLTVTGSNGCQNQITKSINVPIPPVMDFTVTAPCTRTSSVFQEQNPGGADPAVAWNWNFNGQASATGSPASFEFATPGGYSVTLSSTRNSGCIYSVSKNISIYSGPVAQFTPSVQAGPAPLTVYFENNSTADTYFWQFGDPDKTTSNSVAPTFTYLQLGKYKALLTASNSYGCTDTLSNEIDVVIPSVDLAMQNFILRNDSIIVTLRNAGNVPLSNPKVEVDLAGGVLLKETVEGVLGPGKSITSKLNLEIAPQSIEYLCALALVANDINDTNDKKCLSLTGSDFIFTPYPNPSSGKINVDWVSTSDEQVKVSIFTLTGEVAFVQQFPLVASGLVQLSINTSALSNGLYLIRFEGSKVQKTFKIVVAN